MAQYDKRLADLPDNSYAAREGRGSGQNEKYEKVTKGKVSSTPTLSKRLFRAFIMEDAGSVWDYILWQEIIPGLKDMAGKAFDMFLYGSSRPSKSTKNIGGGSVVKYDYDRVSNNRARVAADDRVGTPRRTRGSFDFDDVRFETQSDANDVLQNLFEDVVDYGKVSLAAFYGYAGLSSETEYTDNDFGWTRDMIEGLEAKRYHGGYWVIPLPRPVSIKDIEA